MSISTTTRKAGPFAGNDAQTVFPFAFKVFDASDLVVTRAVAATGVETTLAYLTDYTVSLNVNQDAAPGGSITLLTPLASGLNLAVTSNVPALQAVTITNGAGFFPNVFNGVFDRLTILVQQLAEKLGRSMTIPVTATGVSSLQVPVVPSAVLQWSADGSQLLAQTLPDLAFSLAVPPMTGKAGWLLSNNGTTGVWIDVMGRINYVTAVVNQIPTVGQLTSIANTVATDAAKANNNFAIAAAIVL